MEKSKINSQKASKYKVKITKDGPYIVSGGVPLSEQTMCVDTEGQCHGWKEGKRYPLQENYALCRCGHSQNKPFCDGTHTKIKFDGTEEATHRSYLGQAGEIVGPGSQTYRCPESLCQCPFLSPRRGNMDTHQTIR